MALQDTPTNKINSPLSEQPDLLMKKLAFYDVLFTLIKPTNVARRKQVYFKFMLSQKQLKSIDTNRILCNNLKMEQTLQVQLRFGVQDTSCVLEDCYPPNVSVKVNDKLCQLPRVIPTKPPKRLNLPLNITSNIMESNTIEVLWHPKTEDSTENYSLAVYVVKKLTCQEMLNRMMKNSAIFTRAQIQKNMKMEAEDADCVIATNMLEVSLKCPIGQRIMSMPCRATTCSHLQCFDAMVYLQMNDHRPSWKCPVCNKPAIFGNLFIDGYFQNVLKSTLRKPNVTKIQLHPDGSWSSKTTVDLTIKDSDDDDDDDDENIPPAKRSQSLAANQSAAPES
ncbi:E3 SUMO-protein ligase PIAS1-like [Drosophila innubila]|uniref:E3 SUMO-protein ligase PIAS1-like n=1 Tax=Drosophila innubila TaxID=198719 RepID=UPI00148C8BF0|nr:E3 SUMO-protein ligase PIAS1-like [Drosophila innubila]XP_034482267.1 E3 SUMO-protein ligase PIAS1-like [Drosophila innubila]